MFEITVALEFFWNSKGTKHDLNPARLYCLAPPLAVPIMARPPACPASMPALRWLAGSSHTPRDRARLLRPQLAAGGVCWSLEPRERAGPREHSPRPAGHTRDSCESNATRGGRGEPVCVALVWWRLPCPVSVPRPDAFVSRSLSFHSRATTDHPPAWPRPPGSALDLDLDFVFLRAPFSSPGDGGNGSHHHHHAIRASTRVATGTGACRLWLCRRRLLLVLR